MRFAKLQVYSSTLLKTNFSLKEDQMQLSLNMKSTVGVQEILCRHAINVTA